MYRKQLRRRRAVLALLIVGSFALLTLTYGQGSNGIQRGVTAIFTPISSVLDRALKPARDLINWVDETFDARGKNHKLETEVQALRKEVVGGKVALAENEELRALLKLEKSGAIPAEDGPVTGHVIGLSPTVWFSTVMIDVGSGDGVKVHDPVVNGDGLVGEVNAVTGGASKVRLISDHSSRIGVRVVPAGLHGAGQADGRRTEPARARLHQRRQNAPQRRESGHLRLAQRRNRRALPAQHPGRRNHRSVDLRSRRRRNR